MLNFPGLLDVLFFFTESSKLDEDKALNNLVGFLQDMVLKIPTQGPTTARFAPTMIAIIESFPSSSASPSASPSESPSTIVEAVFLPSTTAAPIAVTETGASSPETDLSSTTTLFWNLRDDNDTTVASSSGANTTEESEMVPGPTSSAYVSDITITGPLSPETTAKQQNTSLDEVASLVNSLQTFENSAAPGLTPELSPRIGLEPAGGNHNQTIGANILTLINKLMGTINNAPASVLQDSALHKQVEIAENYLKNALDLAAEAEKKLHQGSQSSTPAQSETVLHSASSHEPQAQVVEDHQPSPSASTAALQSNVESGALSPSSETSHKPQTEVVIEVVSTPSASSNEPQTEVMLEISSESSTTSHKPQKEEAITPSASSHEPQTEISSEPSTSTLKPQTEVKIEVISVPPTSSPEPQREGEVVSKSTSSPELQTEVVVEVISTPSATSHEPQREMEIGLSTPSVSSHEPQTEEVLEIGAHLASSSHKPKSEMTTEVVSSPSATSHEPQTEVVLEINSEPSTPKPQTEENIVSTPSTSSHGPQTEVEHEITSESSTSTHKPQTEVRIEILTISSTSSPALQIEDEGVSKPTSSHEPQTEVKVEVISTPSENSHAPPTEVQAEVALTPSATLHERQTEVVPEVLSEPSHTPGTEVVLAIHPTPSASELQTQMVIDINSTSLASEETVVLSPSSPESPEKRAQDLQVDMGKLKAFVNLLYGFTPQLTADNLSNKEASKDMVDRVLEVVDAIKDVFCGNKSSQSKKMLKQLLKEDMNLVKQAMKTERVS